MLGADHARAAAGSQRAKDRLGAVSGAQRPPSGPVEFKARHEGRRGHVYITTEATIPAVGFSPEHAIDKVTGRSSNSSGGAGGGDGEEEDLHPIWSIPIAEIRELKKIGGYGWKGKIVVGWSLGREINDGLEISDARGRTVRITAVPLRDELFNRLVALGGLEKLVAMVLGERVAKGDQAVDAAAEPEKKDVRRKAVYAVSSACRNYQPAMDVVSKELAKREGKEADKVDAANMDAVDVVINGLREKVASA